MKIVFFGTPQVAADVFSYLLDKGVAIAAVITKPDKPKGRSGTPVPTPVKAAAFHKAPYIPVYQPEMVSDPAFTPILAALDADLFVVAAYGEIIKQQLLDMPKLACINLHFSLLPKYRGAAPIQRCIVSGETETGVTIIHMSKKMDAGDIISMVRIPIGPDTTFGELEKTLCEAGSKELLNVIHDFENGIITRTPQDHERATFAPKIELEDCEIDWNQSAQSIHNLIRGVQPYPGAWCWVEVNGHKLRLKINKSELVKEGRGTPGDILNYGKTGLIIACGNEALKLKDIQLEGKKAMPAEEMMRGIPHKFFKML